MSPREVYLEIPGTPIPQGSMRVFGGRVCHACPKLKAWRKTISDCIRSTGAVVMVGAIYAYMVFELPRPKSVKRNRPFVPPDLDKLQRASCDAIEMSGIISSDAQICEIQAVKVYSDTPKLKLFLKELG